jgi:preprotein translocase subunit SecG
MGGQSAFGTKAGDVFTKITVWTAIVWFVLCIGVVYYLKHGAVTHISGFGDGEKPAATVPADATTPAGGTPAVPAKP